MDVRSVSRWFGAASLVIGGVAVTVGTAVEPSGDDDSVAVALGKISHHLGDQRALIVTDLLAVFMLPAVLCLMRLARRGAPRLALAGGTLAFAGWLAGLVGLAGLDVVFYEGAQATDRAQATTLIHAVTNTWSYTLLLIVFIAGQVIGMLLLGIALWRARAVPRWAAVVVGAAPIAQVAAHSNTAISAAVFAAFALGLAACAAVVLRMPDADWDAPVAESELRSVDVTGALVSPARASG